MSEKGQGPWKYPKVMRFIEMLRERPIIWDPTNPNYTNQYMRELAYDEISFEMSTTNEKIRQKFHTMRSQFLAECKKFKTRRDYQSPWNYFEALKDLFKFGKASEILNSEPKFDDELQRKQSKAKEESDYELTDPEYEDSLDAFMDDDIKVELKRDYNAKTRSGENKNMPINKRSRTTTESSSYQLQDQIQDMEDAYELFGKCVASELRHSLADEFIHNTLKNKIIQAIVEAKDELQKRKLKDES